MDNGPEILREIKGMKKSMFGEDGTGGFSKAINSLTIAINGDPNSADSRGVVGEVKDMRKDITDYRKEVIEPLKTKAKVNEVNVSRAFKWLGGMSAAIIVYVSWKLRGS